MPEYIVEVSKLTRMIEHVWVDAESKSDALRKARSVQNWKDTELVDYQDVRGEPHRARRVIEQEASDDEQ